MEHHQIFLEFPVMSAEEQKVQNHYMLLYGIVKSIVKWNFITQGLKLQPFLGIF